VERRVRDGALSLHRALVDRLRRIPVMAAADLLRAGLAAVYYLGGALLVLAAAIGRHGIR
jgi:hypothetical protein